MSINISLRCKYAEHSLNVPETTQHKKIPIKIIGIVPDSWSSIAQITFELRVWGALPVGWSTAYTYLLAFQLGNGVPEIQKTSTYFVLPY